MDLAPASIKPLVNGQWAGAVDARDRGLAYGDGVFETVLWNRGTIPLWSLHLGRLARGCERLAIPFPQEAIEAQLDQFTKALQAKSIAERIVIKIILTRGVGGKGYQPPLRAEVHPNLVWHAAPFAPSELARTGIELTECPIRLTHNSRLAGIKHLNRLEYVLAAGEGTNAELGKMPLLQDTLDNVIESLHHNIFLVRNQRLRTPDLGFCGVEGVMRHILLTQPHLKAEIAAITLQDLLAADEVFICNSVRGIWPVVGFMGRQWPIGKATVRLQQFLTDQFGGAYA